MSLVRRALFTGSATRLIMAVLFLCGLSATLAAPSPAVAAPAADPALTLTASAQGVVAGASARLSAHLLVPGAQLGLSGRPAGQADFTPLGAVVADGSGSVAFDVRPGVTTTYRLDYPGSADWSPASAEVTVAVSPRVTLTVRFARPLFVKDRLSLHVRVAPAQPGSEVTIEVHTGEGWRAIRTVTLNDRSRAACRWRVDTGLRFGLHATVAPTADRAAGTSAVVHVFANPWNRFRVPYRPKHYIVIVRHEYHLYYFEHGALVRRFTVALGRPGFPTPLGTFHIYGKREPGGGPLGACVMYYHPAGAIAIHGTDEPWLLRRPVPRNFSHGCCRMYNSQALWLYARCPVGTTVHNLP